MAHLEDPPPFLPPSAEGMAAAMTATKNMYDAAIAAGFTEAQALSLLAKILAEQGRT